MPLHSGANWITFSSDLGFLGDVTIFEKKKNQIENTSCAGNSSVDTFDLLSETARSG